MTTIPPSNKKLSELSYEEWCQMPSWQKKILAIMEHHIAELIEIQDDGREWPIQIQGDSVRVVLTDSLIEQLKSGKRFMGCDGEAVVYLEYKPDDPA